MRALPMFLITRNTSGFLSLPILNKIVIVKRTMSNKWFLRIRAMLFLEDDTLGWDERRQVRLLRPRRFQNLSKFHFGPPLRPPFLSTGIQSHTSVSMLDKRRYSRSEIPRFRRCYQSRVSLRAVFELTRPSQSRSPLLNLLPCTSTWKSLPNLFP